MRWSKLPDIRATKTFSCPAALKLYIYILLTGGEGTPLRISLNTASKIINGTRDAARYAFKILCNEGLINKERDIVRAVTANEIGNLIIDPMPALRKNWARIVASLMIENQAAGELAIKFARKNITANKHWKNEDDVTAHFMSWAELHNRTTNTQREKKAQERQSREKQYQAEQRKQQEEREREWNERQKEKVSYEQYQEMKKQGKLK